jgi:hypothetical protein
MKINEFVNLEIGDEVMDENHKIFQIIDISVDAQKIEIKKWSDSKITVYSQFDFRKHFDVA